MAGSIWSYCSCKGPDGKRYKPGDCPEWGQRAHRKWAFVIDQDRTPEGRRQQLKRMSFPSRQAAERAMEAELPAIRAHIAPTVSGRQTTVSEYLDRWLRTARNSKGKPWRPSTKATYESAARLYLRPLLGRYRLADLRREHVEAMAEAMRDGTFRPPEARPRAVELSDRTVYAAFSVLRAPLFAAMDDHLISANPCQRARVPGPETTEAEVFEVEQARIFLDYVQEAEPQLAPAYRLALQYTLRRGELAGLQWSDIDLDAGTLRVVRAVSEAGRQAHIHEPKTKKGRRVVYLGERMVAVLREHRRAQLERRLAAGPEWEAGSDWVFCDERGRMLRPFIFTHHFKARVRELPELPELHLHSARHTAISHMLADGIDVATVGDQAGHADPAVTLKVYTHALKQRRAATGKRMDRLYGESVTPL